MQVSINGSWWFGLQNSPPINIRTMYEDCEKGSEMQCSTVFDNFYQRVMSERSVPEEFFIGADNTPKETKNNIMMFFLTWLLVVLEGTPLKSTALLFLLVGHTHNRVDRFFSRLKIALHGRDYMTRTELIQVFMESMHGFSFDAFHLNKVWNWKQGQRLFGWEHMKYLHRVHLINVFRTADGIYIKWKQYLTSDQWSKPVLILPRHLFAAMRVWYPDQIKLAFDKNDAQAKNLWLDKLEVALADSVLLAKYKRDIDDLRRVLRMESPEYNSGPNITQMVADIHGVAAGRGPEAIVDCDHELPRDNEAIMFPGGDQLEMQADALVSMEKPWELKMENFICTGSMVICKPMDARVDVMNLPFLLGMLVGPSADEAAHLVQWWVPPMSHLKSFTSRKKTKTPDLFGEWLPYESLPLSSAVEVKLPPVLLEPANMLITNVEIDGGKIPYSAFDTLRADFGIDVTALQYSQTEGGNAYRSYVLMR